MKAPSDELESRIAAVHDAMHTAPSREQVRCCASRLADLISQRREQRPDGARQPRQAFGQ